MINEPKFKAGDMVDESELMEYLTAPEKSTYLNLDKGCWLRYSLMALAQSKMVLEECENWFNAHLSLEPDDQSAGMMLDMITPLVLKVQNDE